MQNDTCEVKKIEVTDDAHNISLWNYAVLLILAYMVVLNIPNTEFTVTNLFISLSIFVIPVLYTSIPLILQENKIYLDDEKIERRWGEEVILIDLKKDFELSKAFIDYYDSRQADESWQKYLGAFFNLLLFHPVMLISKSLYQLYQNDSKKIRLYDNLIVRQGEIVITIPLRDKSIQEIKNFFLTRGIDIENIDTFYNLYYLPLEFINKDK
jgi:hypothetical protein